MNRGRRATKNAPCRSSFVHSERESPEAVQITGLLRFRQPRFVDITYTRRYIWWFLQERVFSFLKALVLAGPGGVAQLGERLNGIQEVRGSIPLTSMAEGAVWNGCLFAGIAQLVEHNLAKVGVAGSSPVSRSLAR